MRFAAILPACVILGTLWGCAFSDWATKPQPDGTIPALEAGKEIVSEGLTGFEKGGIVAGVVGLLFTCTKTGLRLYRQYQDSKETTQEIVNAVSDAVATGGAK